MDSFRDAGRRFAYAVTVVLVTAAWGLFAPTQVGGQVAYAIISGNSMEPGFHRGDLVVLRQANDYAVGEIATYRHPTLGPVIHRIMAENAGHFTFKGDNNTWLDSYQPTQAEMIGKFWLYAPFVGIIIEQVRRPWVTALLVVLVGLVIVLSSVADASRSRGRRRRPMNSSGRRAAVTQSLRGAQADIFSLLVTFGVAALMLGLFAFTRPVTRTVFDEVKYQQSGRFAYSADAPPGIYDGNRVKTGEPIFRRLVSRVNVAFDYRFQTERAEAVEGTSRLVAELASSNGWRATTELQGESSFRGATTHLQGTLDLARLQAMLDDLEQQTGVTGAQYTLSLAPAIAISGTLSGQAVRDVFTPRLLFSFDALQMQLAAQQKGVGDGADPFQPSESKTLRKSREVENTVPLLVLTFSVATARRVAVIGVILWLVAVGAWLVVGRQTQTHGEAARIQAKYGALLVGVLDSALADGRPLVEVVSMDDLAKIAERGSRMILHQTHAGEHAYLVQEDDTTYRYRSTNGATPATARAERDGQ